MIWIIIGIVVIFLILALAIASYSGSQLQEVYNKYLNEYCSSNLTGGELALLFSNSLTNGQIKIARTAGVMTDAYSSKSKTVVISEKTCDDHSVSSLAIVAHEFGHALQHLNDTNQFKLNIALIRWTKRLGYFMFPLAVSGIFIALVFPNLFYLGIILLALSAFILLLAIFLKLIAIPLEKDASKRGIKILKDMKIMNDYELKMAQELLNSALLTYVGDFISAILWWTFLTKKTKYF